MFHFIRHPNKDKKRYSTGHENERTTQRYHRKPTRRATVEEEPALTGTWDCPSAHRLLVGMRGGHHLWLQLGRSHKAKHSLTVLASSQEKKEYTCPHELLYTNKHNSFIQNSPELLTSRLLLDQRKNQN